MTTAFVESISDTVNDIYQYAKGVYYNKTLADYETKILDLVRKEYEAKNQENNISELRLDLRKSLNFVTTSDMNSLILDFSIENKQFPDAIILNKEQYLRLCNIVGNDWLTEYRGINLYVDDLFIKGSIK